MAFHGSQGFFRFKGATSIPQKEVGISGDSRYTRAFLDREPITIHAPFNLTSTFKRGDTPFGFSLPFSYIQDEWDRVPGIPDDFNNLKFSPDLSWNTYASLQQNGDHVFMEEKDGYIYILRNVVLAALAQENAGIPVVYDDEIGSFLSVPYLWGSVIEGIHSGARRFIVGPTKTFVSNPFYGEYNSTSLDVLGNYGDLACDGTGDFASGQMLLVMPEYGTTGTYDESRHNIFNYAADVRLVSGNSTPLNSNFLPQTPFSIENIDYSGFRLRDRKKLPVPYFAADEESLISMVNGTTIEPDRTVYGTSGNPKTPQFSSFVSWKYTGINANPTRRHAFAITKRHLLSLSTPFHNYAYSPDNPYSKDPFGFANAVTGFVPFTDHQPGDKVYFYDKNENRVIERTVVATLPFDVKTVHETLNKIVSGAYPRLESTWNVQYIENCLIYTDAAGVTYNTPCYEYTQLEEGYNTEIALGNYEYILEYEGSPIGGTGDIFEFDSGSEFEDKWLKTYPEITGTESSLEYAEVFSRIRDKFVQNALYKDNFSGFDEKSFGPTSFFEVVPFNYNLGIETGGVTSTTGVGWFDSLMPQNYPIRNMVGGLPINLYTLNNPSGTNPLALQKSLGNKFQESVAFEDSITDVNPTRENIRSSQANQNTGVLGYSAEQSLEQSDPEPENPTGSIPRMEVDPTLPNSTIDEQFYYLPTAARNAIREYFPHGLNNIFYGSFNANDKFRRLLTWEYLTSHFKGLIDGKCSIHLLDQDLPDGVRPISLLDVRRSELHKHEMFVDDQMRGFIAKNCPPQTTFSPIQYFGNVGISGCPRTYGTLNFARTYANPYGESMLNMMLFRVGRCGDDVSNVLDDCGETGNSSSGTECKWGVFQIGVGSNPPMYSNNGNDRGLMYPDVTTQTNCYDCWYNGNDTIERSLPINAKNEDKLNDLTNTKSSWGGQDLPGPLFTYGKSGSPILSRIVTQSLYGSSDLDYRYLYDYVVTGHKGDDIQVGDAIFQNFAGGTGICSYPFDSTFGLVFAYSKDTGRLLLSNRTSHPVLSSDVLIRCDETLRPVGATYGTTSGYVQGTLGFQSCEEISPSTSAGGWKFNHYLGRPGYGYTKKSSGLPYPNDTEVASWMSIERGGPRILGNFWFFGLWYEGLLQSRIQNSKKDDCRFAEREDPVASSNELYLGTHNMGMFLSDQPIYYRSSNPNDPNKFYYFGKVEDIFYRMLNDFNAENGVTGDYRCTKEIIKFDGESDAYNYPNSIAVPKLRTQHPSLTRIYSGVNIRESEFLK